MNFLDKVKKALMIAAFALVAIPAALAYNTYTGYYGSIPSIGVYTTSGQYAQGFYDYVSPPISLPGYSDYDIFNVRDAIYPEFPTARIPNIYRPYYGYQYASYNMPVNDCYNNYGGGGCTDNQFY